MRTSDVGGRPYPPEVRARAAALRREGVGNRVIAERLGVSVATLASWFRRDGVLPTDRVRHERATRWAAEHAQELARRRPGRLSYPPELRQTAAEMRRQGLTRVEIAQELGIGPSTVARWFREDGVDAPVDGLTGRPAALRTMRPRTEERRAAEDAEERAHADAVGPLTARELMLVGAALYWAEGAKSKPWRRKHLLQFSNSDAETVQVFLAFLAQLAVPRADLVCRVQIHRSADAGAAVEWWRDCSGRDLEFGPVTLKRHAPRTTRHNVGAEYHGCLNLYVRGGGALYRRVVGAWQGVVRGVLGDPQSPVV